MGPASEPVAHRAELPVAPGPGWPMLLRTSKEPLVTRLPACVTPRDPVGTTVSWAWAVEVRAAAARASTKARAQRGPVDRETVFISLSSRGHLANTPASKGRRTRESNKRNGRGLGQKQQRRSCERRCLGYASVTEGSGAYL